MSTQTTTIPGIELACRVCGARTPAEPRSICQECFGPLEPVYDLESLRARVTRESIAAGPPTLWRYRDLLPAPAGEVVDLGAGFTPLRRARRLGERLGIPELWIKDDTPNPTGSFKDRVVAVALSAARAFGYTTVGCASTGNLASAVAAAAAWAGLEAYIFIPSDLERPKVVGTAAFGAKVVAVEGTYDDVNRLVTEVADAYPWAFVNVNVRPYYAEGSKTLAFETAEQLGWHLPDHVVVPVASGALLTRIHKGFGQLVEIGLVDEHPVRISGAQPSGCAPVAAAFKDGTDEITPVRPDTIARSLAIGSPADGHFASKVARQTGGAIEDVTDEEVVSGIRLLAETEGLFTETAGGVTIATLSKLRDAGVVRADEVVVAYVTGTGWKTAEVLEGAVGPAFAVPPSLEAFSAHIDKEA